MRENARCYIKNDNDDASKELVIIGNGPSFKFQEIKDKSDAIDYCMVNHACQTAEFKLVKPKMYILADPAFIKNSCTSKVKCTWEILATVDWEMTVYVPFYMFVQAKEFLKQSNVKLSCFHSVSFIGWPCLMFAMYNKNLAMPQPYNVMIPSIYVGIMKGYKKIRLLGVDHSWTEQLRVNAKNQVCIRQIHYYDSKVELIPWNDETGTPFTMRFIMKRFSDIFEQYEVLEKYAKSRGVSIINTCLDSYIDAFTKNND